MAQSRHVNPNLMRAARMQFALHQATVCGAFQQSYIGYGRFTRVFQAVLPVDMQLALADLGLRYNKIKSV